MLLLSASEKNNENTVISIITTSLSNLFSNTNTDVFLQCLSGVRDVTTSSTGDAECPSPSASVSSSTSLSSSSSSLPSCPMTHSLSVTSSAALLEKAAEVVFSTSVGDRDKQDVLDTLLDVVDAGVMNEAAEFVAWRKTQPEAAQSNADSCGSGGAGGRGGNGKKNGKEDDGIDASSLIPADQFIRAFENFTESVKILSQAKKRRVLAGGAAEIYARIQEKKFFPTFVAIGGSKEPEKLPLNFINNSSFNHVTNSKGRLYWNSPQWATFFVDQEMNEGLYNVSMEVNGQTGGGEGIGLAIKTLLNSFSGSYLATMNGTCCLQYGHLYCGTTSVTSSSFCMSGNGKVTLGLELNANKHILYFFVNGAQIPHCVINVPTSVYFGYTGYYAGLSVELKSLTKLTAPSIDPSTTCTSYAWRS